jgi:hypothetical protein
MSTVDLIRDLVSFLVIPLLISAGSMLIKINSRLERIEAKMESSSEVDKRHDEAIGELYDQTRDIDRRLSHVEARING